MYQPQVTHNENDETAKTPTNIPHKTDTVSTPTHTNGVTVPEPSAESWLDPDAMPTESGIGTDVDATLNGAMNVGETDDDGDDDFGDFGSFSSSTAVAVPASLDEGNAAESNDSNQADADADADAPSPQPTTTDDTFIDPDADTSDLFNAFVASNTDTNTNTNDIVAPSGNTQESEPESATEEAALSDGSKPDIDNIISDKFIDPDASSGIDFGGVGSSNNNDDVQATESGAALDVQNDGSDAADAIDVDGSDFGDFSAHAPSSHIDACTASPIPSSTGVDSKASSALEEPALSADDFSAAVDAAVATAQDISPDGQTPPISEPTDDATAEQLAEQQPDESSTAELSVPPLSDAFIDPDADTMDFSSFGSVTATTDIPSDDASAASFTHGEPAVSDDDASASTAVVVSASSSPDQQATSIDQPADEGHGDLVAGVVQPKQEIEAELSPLAEPEPEPEPEPTAVVEPLQNAPDAESNTFDFDESEEEDFGDFSSNQLTTTQTSDLPAQTNTFDLPPSTSTSTSSASTSPSAPLPSTEVQPESEPQPTASSFEDDDFGDFSTNHTEPATESATAAPVADDEEDFADFTTATAPSADVSTSAVLATASSAVEPTIEGGDDDDEWGDFGSSSAASMPTTADAQAPIQASTSVAAGAAPAPVPVPVPVPVPSVATSATDAVGSDAVAEAVALWKMDPATIRPKIEEVVQKTFGATPAQPHQPIVLNDTVQDKGPYAPSAQACTACNASLTALPTTRPSRICLYCGKPTSHLPSPSIPPFKGSLIYNRLFDALGMAPPSIPPASPLHARTESQMAADELDEGVGNNVAPTQSPSPPITSDLQQTSSPHKHEREVPSKRTRNESQNKGSDFVMDLDFFSSAAAVASPSTDVTSAAAAAAAESKPTTQQSDNPLDWWADALPVAASSATPPSVTQPASASIDEADADTGQEDDFADFSSASATHAPTAAGVFVANTTSSESFVVATPPSSSVSLDAFTVTRAKPSRGELAVQRLRELVDALPDLSFVTQTSTV